MDNYQQAVKYFSEGNVDSAVSLLEKMYKRNRKDFDALNFLGIIAFKQNKFDSASKYFNKVVRIYDRHPDAHYNLGLCYQILSDNDSAIKHYSKTIRFNPNHYNALLNLGVIYYNMNELEKAEQFYESAIKINPKDPNLLNNFGNLLIGKAEYDGALTYYMESCELSPSNATFVYNLGNCYMHLKQDSEAINCFKSALQLKPDYVEASNNLASCFINSNQTENAREVILQGLKHNPDHLELNFNLAYLYQLCKDNAGAVAQYEKVLELDPTLGNAIINIANVYNEESDFESSEKYYNLALKNEETRALTLTNIATIKIKQNRIDESITILQKALELNQHLAETHYNLAFALLKKGRFEEGWSEYEWRMKLKNFKNRDFSKPKLEDQDIKNKAILVCDEQGVGDTIQFGRYLNLLKEQGAIVVFEASPQSYELSKCLDGIDKLLLMQSDEEPISDYDYYSPLASLPKYFGTTAESVPWDGTYIKVERGKSEKWNEFFGDQKKLKVGVVWTGNPKNTHNSIRSCPLSEIVKLTGIEGVQIYSLQIGCNKEDLKKVEHEGMILLDEYINDYSDTAAIIENLDLVVSVCTSVAHLAGALGKKVLIPLGYASDWRWMMDRTDSPWYPTVKLFRPEREGQWDEVINEIKTELTGIAGINSPDHKLPGTDVEKDTKILPQGKTKLYLALTHGENFGWGVCSKYLRSELSKRIEIENVIESDQAGKNPIKGKVFHAIADLEFNSLSKLRGDINYGYTFFENELLPKSVENSKTYDIVIGGSSWCVKKMNEKGIYNTDILIQGIDPEVFYPLEPKKYDNLFVIFSGGKFELRKGQDLVLRAVKYMQDKYSDVILINAWYNGWSHSLATMAGSKHINYNPSGNSWEEFMQTIYAGNGLDPSRIFTLPLTPNNKLRELYAKSDVGLFPNRCEGGTNLVMMEYMACAKPVIGSYNTGHKDVLTESNSLMLKNMSKFEIYDGGTLAATWEEPDPDEIIQQLEYAYQNRDMLVSIGRKAGEDLKNYTWGNTAEELIKIVS